MKMQSRPVIGSALVATLAMGTSAFAGGLIINEYNAVADANFTEFDPLKPWEGYDHGAILTATAGAGNSTLTGRPRDGRIQGNANNWIELVVTQDYMDIRGFTLEWSNADPDQGSFTFSQNPLWSNLRAGTIITVIEDGIFTPTFDDLTTGAQVNFGTNVSFNPAQNDWWINLDVDDVTYLSQSGFKIDNDNWQGTIKDAQGATVFGPVGEAVAGGWGGGGLNSQEIAVLSADPSAASTGLDFDDNDYSTFGAPNIYNQFTQTQDFSALRTWWTNRIPGDANVDGAVNLDDFNVLAGNFNQSGFDWFGADFTGDGNVNLDDFNILAANFNTGAGAEVTPEDWAALAAAIPEPSALLLVGVPTSVGMFFGRRRRAHHN